MRLAALRMQVPQEVKLSLSPQSIVSGLLFLSRQFPQTSRAQRRVEPASLAARAILLQALSLLGESGPGGLRATSPR